MSDFSNSAVAEPLVNTVRRRRALTRNKPRRQPRYHVILWNDEDHSYDYVIGMLQELFAHPVESGFKIADEIHRRGRGICLTTSKEHAELKRGSVRDGLVTTDG